MTITVYSKNNCMPCKMTKKALTEAGIPFSEINVDLLPEEERWAVIDFIKVQYEVKTLPVTVARDKVIVGFRPSELKALSK